MEATVRQSTGSAADHVRKSLGRQLAEVDAFPAVVACAFNSNPIAWLAQQPQGMRLLWGQRGESEIAVGSGAALRLDASDGMTPTDIIGECRRLLRSLPGERFYGGFSFRTDSLDPPWDSFGRGAFWLPRVSIRNQEIRVVVTSEEDCAAAQDAIDRIVFSPAEAWVPSQPTWHQRTDTPDRDGWETGVRSAIELIRNEVLEKIVLARRVDLDCSSTLDPVGLAATLAECTPACYHFCFEPEPGIGFIGASPERLLCRTANRIATEAIAGTRPRGATEAADQQLAGELLLSEKDQLEHEIVRKSIRQRLHRLVDHLEVDDQASLLQLASKQHLVSRVSGTLGPDVDDGTLVERLHPTPAVGGYPTENAMDEIQRLEPFERGWYAAPVGWIDSQAIEFAVAIRSGLVRGSRLSLFSGAGIVSASTPQQEWDEIEHKISDFIRLTNSTCE